MDTLAKTKQNLILKIEESDDLDLLKFLEKVLLLKSSEKLYRLGPEQEKAVAESREQYSRGEFLDSEEAISNLREWLKNQ
ncbi:hypothetical protein ACW6QP_10175 [Salegentibacter sp. HM20]